jgi:putative nucleotide binding protein
MHRRYDQGRKPDQYLHKGTTVYILDILQHGGVDRGDKSSNRSWQPVCQVLQVPSYNFFEVALQKDAIISVQQRIEITQDQNILGRIEQHLKYTDLTHTSKEILPDVLQLYIKDNEPEFVKFINNAQAITIKRHSLEVLPGVGKKLMWDIINERQKQPFANFIDLKKRVPGIKIEEMIAKRIVEELSDPETKHFMFVKKPRPQEPPRIG